MAIIHRDYSSPALLALLKAGAESSKQAIDVASQVRKANQEKEAQSRAVEQAKKLSDDNPGSNVSVSDRGAAISHDFSAANAQKQTSEQAKAISKLHDAYGKGSDKIASQVQAIGELSDAISGNNQMSLGTARTLALKSMGMNRYNEAEAKAVLPSTLQSRIGGLFAAGGGDSTPLTAAQQKDLMAFRDSMLKRTQEHHEQLKDKAIAQYADSPYADPNRIADFRNSLGKSLDSQIGKITAEKPAAMAQAQPEAPRNEGVMGMLKGAKSGLASLLFGDKGAPEAPAAAAPAPGPASPPAAPGAAPAAKPDLSALLKGPAAAPAPAPIRVKLRSTGQTGTVPANEFDPNIYDKL